MRELLRGLVVVAVACCVFAATAASAGWRDSASASMGVSSGSLVAPTGLSGSPGCLTITHRVTLAWTPTASPGAVGYRVFRRAGSKGAFGLATTLPGRTTSGYTDGPLAASTKYTYYVEAYVGAWTAPTPNISVTTHAVCL